MPLDNRFIRGADRLKQRIATIRAATALPPLVDEVSELLLRRTKERFDNEVTPDNVPWVPLKDSTLRRKAQLGYGAAKKLVRTEALRKAITIIRGSVADTTFSNTGAGRRIGIQDPEIAEYGRIQNKGQRGRIPARRFLGVGRLDVKAVDSFLRRKAREIEGL